MVGRLFAAALLVVLALMGCKSEEMKKCLKMCDEVAAGKAGECTGPKGAECKAEIAAADAECRAACKELITD